MKGASAKGRKNVVYELKRECNNKGEECIFGSSIISWD
jgi:hypothetical protein